MTLPPTIQWRGSAEEGVVEIVDQRLLPLETRLLQLRSAADVWEAIRELRVRGAPAIGVAAAMGVVLGLRPFLSAPPGEFLRAVDQVCQYLSGSRPTAVNLFWALDRMRQSSLATDRADAHEMLRHLHEEALRIQEEDLATCKAIGHHGAELIPDGARILTHCNAGALATAGYGTALGCVRAAQEQGKSLHVYVDETRPLLQGARLTAYELMAEGIETTLLCDSMAAVLMQQGRVDLCLVGADRVAACGDVANKVGTYALALVAAAHRVPLYVAAPLSTFDLTLESGGSIPIETRPSEEVTQGMGVRTAPPGVRVFNPAFDVTPAALIRALVTEHGVIHQPDADRVRAHVEEARAETRRPPAL